MSDRMPECMSDVMSQYSCQLVGVIRSKKLIALIIFSWWVSFEVKKIQRIVFWQGTSFKFPVFRLGALPNVSCLCLITDGMDQAKFRTPRTKKRQTKLFSTMHRPCLHVSACWAHGWALCLAIGDEDLKKNSECTMEQVARTLDKILYEKKNLPAGVNLQAELTIHIERQRISLSLHSQP